MTVTRKGLFSNNNSQCPECFGAIIIEDVTRGDSICYNCGLILNEKNITISQFDRRAFNSDEMKKRRTSDIVINPSLPNEFNTYISPNEYYMNSDQKRIFQKDRYMPYRKRHILMASIEINRIISVLELPRHLKYSSLRVYEKVLNYNLLKGRSINAMASAILYCLIKQERLPFTFEDIIRLSNAREKTVRNSYRVLYRLMEDEEIKIGDKNLKEELRKSNLINPAYKYMTKFTSLLELPTDIDVACTKLLKLYLEKTPFLKGIDPKGLCAGIIYLICKKKKVHRSQKEISKVCEVTEVTLRSRLKDLLKKFSIDKSSLL